MADSDKNILITPNRGATSQPSVVFTGQGNDPITVRVLDGTTGTGLTAGGALSFEGSAGQLFSVVNRLGTGSIFSVNDISGIPSIDVDANGTIEFAPFTGYVAIGLTLPTEKLHVAGNVLVTGRIDSLNGISAQGATFTRLNVVSGATNTSPVNITASSLVDGVGILRLNGSEPDINLNDTDGGFNTITFENAGNARNAFGRNSSNEFYLAVRDPAVSGGAWKDNVLVANSSSGNISMGYQLSVVGGLSASGGLGITGGATFNGNVRVNSSNTLYLNAIESLNAGQINIDNRASARIAIGDQSLNGNGTYIFLRDAANTFEISNPSGDIAIGDPLGVNTGNFISYQASSGLLTGNNTSTIFNFLSSTQAQTGTTYTFLNTDCGKVLTFNNASPITVTIPTGLPVGFNCTVIQLGAGQVGFTNAAGLTLQSYGNQYKLIGQNASATVIEYTTNIVNLSGNLIV